MLRRGGVNFFFYTVLFFPSPWFCPTGFPGKVFNEAVSWKSKGEYYEQYYGCP